MATELEPHSAETEEKQLCVRCMAPNDPTVNFCAECGSPLSSYASTGPFEHLLAEGSVYRQAAEHPQKLVVVIGVWLMFGIFALTGLAFLIKGMKGSLTETFFGVVIGLPMVVVAVVMIRKTTRNYGARKRVVEEADGVK